MTEARLFRFQTGAVDRLTGIVLLRRGTGSRLSQQFSNGKDVEMATKPKSSYYRNKRSGPNKFGYARQQGRTSYSATGATKRQAYYRLKKGLGESGG